MDTVDMLHAAEDRIGLLTQAARQAIEAWESIAVWPDRLSPRESEATWGAFGETMGRLKSVAESPFCRCESGEDCEEECCGCQCHASEEWSDEAGHWVVTYPLDNYAGSE